MKDVTDNCKMMKQEGPEQKKKRKKKKELLKLFN